ncbi:MAG: sodium/solute symporter, partial [Planctomycetes bacterium]|nr:sodium/solute symporter [Planctomycetota bacterium]
AWDKATGKIETRPLPPLPQPSVYLAAARIGRTVYVVPGWREMDTATPQHAMWRLDLSLPASTQAWQECDPCPGGPRRCAVLAMQVDGGRRPYLYLFGGLVTGRGDRFGSGEVSSREAFRFDPEPSGGRATWQQIQSVPRSVAAGSAVDFGQSHVLVFGGVVEDRDTDLQRTARDLLAYHTITDTWVTAGETPRGLAYTNAVRWEDRIVLPGGQDAAGIATSEVLAATADFRPARFGVANYVVLAVYLSLLVAMGVYFSRREKGTDDFFLAGGRIPWWAAGLSIYATQLSAITFVSLPAVAYSTDWLILPGYLCIFLMAPVVIWFYLPFFRRLKVTTAYEYLEHRFSLAVRLFGSLSFIVYQFGRMAIVVYLPALALSAVTGMNMYVCILLIGLLSTAYTVLGGMEAVIWTDVLQVMVLWGGMLLAMAIVVFDVGGAAPAFEMAEAADKFRMFDWSWSWTQMTTWIVLLGTFALQFAPYTTDQAVIQRYMTTKDERASARGIWLNGFLSVVVSLLFFVLGTCLFVFFREHPEALAIGMENDKAFPWFVAEKMPVGLAGLVVAGVFAASMSSLDSSMHSVATAVTTDFYRRFRPGAADHHCLRIARGLTLLIGLLGTAIALILASSDIRSLFFYFQTLLGLITSGLVGVFILGIFTRRANAAGSLIGAAVSTGLLFYVTQYTSLHFYWYAIIGIGSCVVVGYICSWVTPSGRREITELTVYSLNPKRSQ